MVYGECSGCRQKADDGDAAFGTIDSWLVYKLTKGKSYKTDYSNASRTQLLNLTTLKWDEQLCDIFGIPVKALPEISDSNSVFGETDFEGYLEKPIPICGYLGIPMVRCLDTTAEKKVR